jgi:hypothetical protein
MLMAAVFSQLVPLVSPLGQLLMLLAAAISQLGLLVSSLGQLMVLCPPPGELVSKDGGRHMVVESRNFRSAASPLGQLPMTAISQLEQL